MYLLYLAAPSVHKQMCQQAPLSPLTHARQRQFSWALLLHPYCSDPHKIFVNTVTPEIVLSVSIHTCTASCDFVSTCNPINFIKSGYTSFSCLILAVGTTLRLQQDVMFPNRINLCKLFCLFGYTRKASDTYNQQMASCQITLS